MAMPAPAYYAIAQPEPPQPLGDSVSFLQARVIIPFVGGVKTASPLLLRAGWSRIWVGRLSQKMELLRFDAGFMWEKIPQINTYYSAQAFESFGVGGWG